MGRRLRVVTVNKKDLVVVTQDAPRILEMAKRLEQRIQQLREFGVGDDEIDLQLETANKFATSCKNRVAFALDKAVKLIGY